MFYGRLVKFMLIWYDLGSIGTALSILVSCTKKAILVFNIGICMYLHMYIFGLQNDW
jgi:hypothetical protein